MATLGGRREAGIGARQHYRARDNRSSNKNERWHQKLRLKISESPIEIHLQRPEKAYIDPTNPEFSYWWKIGEKYFLKTKRFKDGIMVEYNYAEDLIDAYKSPAKYGFQGAAELADGRWLKDFDPKMYYCVSGWVEKWFHLVEKSYEKNGEEKSFSERILCEGRNCKNCKDKVPKVFGNRFWLDFNYTQWHYIVDAEYEKLEHLTKDGGYAWITHYECPHCKKIFRFMYEDRKTKESKEITLDITNQCQNCGSTKIALPQDEDDNWTHKAECQDCNEQWSLLVQDDKIQKFAATSELPCLSCGKLGNPEPIWVQSNGLEKGKWEAYDIYDVQLTISKNHEHRIEIHKVLIQDPDQRLFDPSLQSDDNVIANKIVDAHKKGLDLNKVHPPAGPDHVATLLEVPNLFDLEINVKAGPRIVKPGQKDVPQEPEIQEPEAPPTVPIVKKKILVRQR